MRDRRKLTEAERDRVRCADRLRELRETEITRVYRDTVT